MSVDNKGESGVGVLAFIVLLFLLGAAWSIENKLEIIIELMKRQGG